MAEQNRTDRASNAAPATGQVNFEQQLGELERIVDQLERGDLSLEDSVSLFERGMQLSASCKGQLEHAESRIQVLLQPRERGPVQTEALSMDEDEESSPS